MRYLSYILLFFCCIGAGIYTKNQPHSKRPWTLIVYIAARNNLSEFVEENIKEMETVGRLHNINVVFQIDKTGNKYIHRSILEKGKYKVVSRLPQTKETISGTPESLFNCVEWAHKAFPSNKLGIIIRNHGTGPLDPKMTREPHKGIAFNDEHNTYLTTTALGDTLYRIREELLHGKKINIVGFDACYMSTIEIAYEIMDSAKMMVASQEAELGKGWIYKTLLQPFTSKALPEKLLSSHGFASHMVKAYQREYDPWMPRYTLAAISLSHIKALHKEIAALIYQFKSLCNDPELGHPMRSLFQKIRSSKKLTASFHHSDYIDFIQLLKVLRQFLGADGGPNKKHLQKELGAPLKSLINHLERSIVKRVSGSDLPFAHGLSVYYPKKKVSPGYSSTLFAQMSRWPKLISKLVMKKKSRADKTTTKSSQQTEES